jgi:hypothetical protein
LAFFLFLAFPFLLGFGPGLQGPFSMCDDRGSSSVLGVLGKVQFSTGR